MPPPPSPSAGRHEVHLYGLHPSVDSASLTKWFSGGGKVMGVLLHPMPLCRAAERRSDPFNSNQDMSDPRQWAQVWMSSEEEVQKIKALKPFFLEKNIEVFVPSPLPSPGRFTPESTPKHEARGQQHPSGLPTSFFERSKPIVLANTGASGPPRNLYILGLPIDMTPLQFRALFSPYGLVEHSVLLSQLDGAGRRRGFILMSTHREAVVVIEKMNGTFIDGYWIDVSYSLVQREARHFQGAGAFPNRVVHPPAVPTRQDPLPESSVFVENLNPTYFPSASAIQEIFSHFGQVCKVTKLPSAGHEESLSVIIAFEHQVSADALINANGMSVGGKPIYTRSLVSRQPRMRDFYQDQALKEESPPPEQRHMLSSSQDSLLPRFDPFREDIPLPSLILPQVNQAKPDSRKSDGGSSFGPISRPISRSASRFSFSEMSQSLDIVAKEALESRGVQCGLKLNPEIKEFVPTQVPSFQVKTENLYSTSDDERSDLANVTRSGGSKKSSTSSRTLWGGETWCWSTSDV